MMKRPKLCRYFPCLVTSTSSLQMFLGMAGWYHCFVFKAVAPARKFPRIAERKFSRIAEPLNAFKRKGSKYMWTQACQTAFETLKTLLVSPPILGHPDFNLPFIVYTDANDVGLGAVLAQPTGLGTESVTAFASRTLNPAERNYSTTEQECLAVVWAEILSRRKTIHCSHRSFILGLSL